MKRTILTLILFLSGLAMAQLNDLAGQLYFNYENYKEPAVLSKRFKHQDILPLIEKLKENRLFNVSVAGTSVQGRDIYLISAGTGKTKIFMWSQMHGDEPTATMAILDIFRFLTADDQFNSLRKNILDNTTLYFLPMVNPDGAEVFKRRNSFDIDLNRDASRKTTPEGRALKDIFDYLKADFGFNLHDQSIYYAAGRSPRSAAISFLAPAGNFDKSIDSVRLNAMKLISNLHTVISDFIPGHIGKYDDAHEPRAFGDNFQKWGTSTILIETGGWKDDPDKQFLRKINFLLLTTAMISIADKTYLNSDVEVYNSIPFNEEVLKDLIIRNVEFVRDGTRIKIDLSVDRIERIVDGKREYYSVIDDIGDLSIFYGYEDYDFTGYEIHPGKIYTNKIKSPDKLKDEEYLKLIEDGYTGFIFDGNTSNLKKSFLMNITRDKGMKNDIGLGHNASFYLTKNGSVDYVFVNGFMYDVKNKINKIHNPYIKK
jgi:hypothetical protein